MLPDDRFHELFHFMISTLHVHLSPTSSLRSQQLILQALKTGLRPHQILLNPQILARKRIVVKSPLRIFLECLQIPIQLLSRLPKSLAPILTINLQERSMFPRSRRPYADFGVSVVQKKMMYDKEGKREKGAREKYVQ